MTTKRFLLLQEIDRLVCIKKTGNSSAFAQQLGISRSTLFEYIALLRDLGAPIQYDRMACTFYYSTPGQFHFKFKKKIFFGESGNIAET